MNEQTAKILINFLNQLGLEVTSKVENLVEVSYPVLIKQVYVQGMEGLMWFLIGLVACYLIYRWTLFVNKKIKTQEFFEDWGVGYLLTVFGGFISLAASFGGLYWFLARIINPQWYAAKLIFELIKSGGM